LDDPDADDIVECEVVKDIESAAEVLEVKELDVEVKPGICRRGTGAYGET
jgi:hypothetical protein